MNLPLALFPLCSHSGPLLTFHVSSGALFPFGLGKPRADVDQKPSAHSVRQPACEDTLPFL